MACKIIKTFALEFIKFGKQYRVFSCHYIIEFMKFYNNQDMVFTYGFYVFYLNMIKSSNKKTKFCEHDRKTIELKIYSCCQNCR